MRVFECLGCGSEIAIDERTIYSIDCDCGREITESEAVGLSHEYKFQCSVQSMRNENV